MKQQNNALVPSGQKNLTWDMMVRVLFLVHSSTHCLQLFLHLPSFSFMFLTSDVFVHHQHHIIVRTIFSPSFLFLLFLFIHKSMTDSNSHFFISAHRADILDEATQVWCLSLVSNHTVCHTGISSSILGWQNISCSAAHICHSAPFSDLHPLPSCSGKKKHKKARESFTLSFSCFIK